MACVAEEVAPRFHVLPQWQSDSISSNDEGELVRSGCLSRAETDCAEAAIDQLLPAMRALRQRYVARDDTVITVVSHLRRSAAFLSLDPMGWDLSLSDRIFPGIRCSTRSPRDLSPDLPSGTLLP